MNVNIKISITDPERNLIARKLAGKPVKRMVTRKEVNELVLGFMEGLLSDLEGEYWEDDGNPNRTLPNIAVSAPDLSAVPHKYQDKPVSWQVGWLRGWEKVGQKRSY